MFLRKYENPNCRNSTKTSICMPNLSYDCSTFVADQKYINKFKHSSSQLFQGNCFGKTCKSLISISTANASGYYVVGEEKILVRWEDSRKI